MILIPQEQKMVAKLRKKQRMWRWAKWVILIEGLVLVIVTVCTLIFLASLANPEDEFGIFLFFSSYPVLMFGGAMGGIMVGTAIRDWHGNTTDTLLLKLLDEQAVSKVSVDN